MNKYLATYGKPRFLGIVTLTEDEYLSIKTERLLVVMSHRGLELAELVGLIDEEQEREYRSLRTISEHGEGPVRGGDPVVTDLDFVRRPSEDDMATHVSQADAEDEFLRTAQELVTWHQLPIKLVDAETLLDEKKLFFYFTSDQRVDFRTLVKDLARRFKTRIELRQMGVRDEARIIKGLSSCGLPCCCSYWLNQFAPIGIKMVKEQNIALNPAKISGICGRLMCCMAFEHKVYKDLWTGLPGPGSKIKTANGNFIVLSMDIAKEAVRCHKPTGGDVLVPVALFGEFREAVMNGEEWEPPQDALADPLCGKKSSCDGCRSKFTNQNTDRAGLYSVPAKDEKKQAEADASEKTARKRSGRRRGRRGGNKPKPAGEMQAVQAQPQVHDAKTPRPHENKPRKHHTPKPQDATATVKTEDAAAKIADGEKSKRPRRRRRRPKRPGTAAPSDGAE